MDPAPSKQRRREQQDPPAAREFPMSFWELTYPSLQWGLQAGDVDPPCLMLATESCPSVGLLAITPV